MSHLQQRLALFKYPAFRLFLVSAILANMGSGLSYIAITWLALADHNSLVSVATLMICFWLPGIILGPFAGVIVDRIQSRQYLIGFSNLCRAAILIVFGLYVIHHHNLHALYWLGMVLGVFFSLYMPSAIRLIREMVPEKDLLYANATIDMVYEVGNLVGMGLAGFLILLFSTAGAFIINGVLFVVSSTCMLMIRKKHLTSTSSAHLSWNIIKGFKDGVRYLFSEKTLIAVYVIQLILFIEYMTAPILLSPFAKNILHANVGQYGEIDACLSIGIIVGGIIIPWLADTFGRLKIIFIVSAILGVCYVLFSYNRSILIAELDYFIIGITFAVWPLIITRAQELTDVNFQGRVQSCFSSLSGLMILLVYLCVRYASGFISIQSLYWIEAIFTVIALIMLIRFRQVFSSTMS